MDLRTYAVIQNTVTIVGTVTLVLGSRYLGAESYSWAGMLLLLNLTTYHHEHPPTPKESTNENHPTNR